MLRRVLTTTVILSVALACVGFWACEQKAAAAKPKPVVVSETVAAEGRVAVKPDQRSLLAAEVAGRIDRLLVDNLSPVKKGQLLAVLFNEDLEQRIHQTEETYHKAEAYYSEVRNGHRRQDIEESAALVRKAEAALDLARSNEARDAELFHEDVISRSRYDATLAEQRQAESELAAAGERYTKIEEGERSEVVAAAYAEMMAQKFALASLKAAYEKTLVRAPLDGIVIARFKNLSEFADVGQPIVEVADLSEMIIEADVNEMDAGRVAGSKKVIVTCDAFPGKKFSGEVYEVSAALKQRTNDPDDPAVIVDQKILPVKVKFLEPVPLKLGMKVDLRIVL